MNSKKKIIVFAGPSGVGKSTLCNLLLHAHPDSFSFAVSAVTRSVRINEQHGVDYYFLSEEVFKEKIEAHEFVEWEEVYPGRYYGTLVSEVERIDGLGKKTVLDIDVLGALNIKKKYGDEAHIIFVKPESPEVLEERLRSRGSENEEDIQVRIERFEKELSFEQDFDSIIVNKTGDIEGSKNQIEAILDTYFK